MIWIELWLKWIVTRLFLETFKASFTTTLTGQGLGETWGNLYGVCRGAAGNKKARLLGEVVECIAKCSCRSFQQACCERQLTYRRMWPRPTVSRSWVMVWIILKKTWSFCVEFLFLIWHYQYRFWTDSKKVLAKKIPRSLFDIQVKKVYWGFEEFHCSKGCNGVTDHHFLLLRNCMDGPSALHLGDLSQKMTKLRNHFRFSTNCCIPHIYVSRLCFFWFSIPERTWFLKVDVDWHIFTCSVIISIPDVAAHPQSWMALSFSSLKSTLACRLSWQLSCHEQRAQRHHMYWHFALFLWQLLSDIECQSDRLSPGFPVFWVPNVIITAGTGVIIFSPRNMEALSAKVAGVQRYSALCEWQDIIAAAASMVHAHQGP